MAFTDAAACLRAARLRSRAELGGHPRSVARIVSGLLRRGVDGPEVARVVARVNDALLRRLVTWREAELGPPPAPFAWIAWGSQGRMEQTLLTDQDNALVYADEGETSRAWYAALAERVNQDLVTAGFPECPGGHMAKHDHGPLSRFVRRAATCVEKPDAHDAEILLDRRRLAGRLPLAAIDAELARGAGASRLLHFLAIEALELSPPSPLVLSLRRGAEVDLKRHGLSPLVFLARCHGLEAGATSGTTLARLEAARRAGVLSADAHAEIAEAYRFLLGLQLRVQVRALEAGEPPSNRVRLDALAPPERAGLRSAFRVVKRWQTRAAYHYQTLG
jgi:CBS domain-containing protein